MAQQRSAAEQRLCAAQPAPLIRRFFAFGIDLIIIGTPATAVIEPENCLLCLAVRYRNGS
jgi:hypothetical protein